MVNEGVDPGMGMIVRELGLKVGSGRPGPTNSIVDVPGVAVGHVTLRRWTGDHPCRTGVTAILPHGGDLFREKVPGAAWVVNGYGKATGLIQLETTGLLETPLILTNTFAVGTAWNAVVRYVMKSNPDAGGRAGTVNPVVAECSDARLNDLRQMWVTEADVLSAIQSARPGPEPLQEGDVGAGTGMMGFGLKGGIGSASRILDGTGTLGSTLGVLVLLNCGALDDLRIMGAPAGERLRQALGPKRIAERTIPTEQREPPSSGSIIMVVATDAPLSHHELRRVIRRAEVGLARCGAYNAARSGDFVIGFRAGKARGRGRFEPALTDDELNQAFSMVADATEEAILSALVSAHDVVRDDGHVLAVGLADHLSALL